MGKSQEEITLMLLNTLERIYFGKSARELAEFLQGEMKVLSYICNRCEGEILPGKIAAGLEMTGGRVAGILRTLEKKGFINRRRAEDDRRKILVTPTEAGRSYIAEKTDVLINILSAVVGRIGEKEALQLVASLDLWNTAYTDVAFSEANTDE